jgi:predicted DCC family thiol-disulfide oxidoreductase YuxK
MADPANPILLYDGVCGLCNRLVQFVLKHDAKAYFRFAPLQSNYAARVLKSHDLDPKDLNTLYLVEPDKPLRIRSDAVIFVLRKLGGFWGVAGFALRIVPKAIRDWGYGIAARNRYRIFGKYESCLLAEQKYQDRFLDA